MLAFVVIQGILKKPNKVGFDANSPIYKKDDPEQAGEAGKAVKVDKTVCFFFSNFESNTRL